MRVHGNGRVVFACALIRARAGMVNLPYGWHLVEVTFRA